MNGELEFKSITSKVADVDTKKGIVVMNWAGYGNVDRNQDVFEKKSFSDSLDGTYINDVVYWLKDHMHTVDAIVGKVLKLEETETNLVATGKAYDQNIIQLYADGVLRQHSAGYIVKESFNDETTGIRHIQKAVLLEGSTTLWGINKNTDTVEVKSLTLQDCEDEISVLGNAIKNGSYSEEYFPLLELKLMSVRKMYRDLLKETMRKEGLPTEEAEVKKVLSKGSGETGLSDVAIDRLKALEVIFRI